MKKYIFVVLILVISSVGFCAETFTVSMTDVNRIVCPEAVKDVFFSEEKGLISKVSGTDVFIKFPVTIVVDQQTGDKTTKYSNQNAEVFLVCGGSTRSLLLKPARISAQTIILKQEINDLGSIEEFKGKDEEEILSALMKAAIENRIPSGFKDTRKNEVWDIERGGAKIKVVYHKEYFGSGYKVKEFRIHSLYQITILPPELTSFRGVSNPAAAMLTAENFTGWTRAFVIERKASDK